LTLRVVGSSSHVEGLIERLVKKLKIICEPKMLVSQLHRQREFF
jgi:hypothetical protein